MIIVRVPFRISFLGGGTDYPEFFEKYSGQVLSTTINKYCYISMRHLPPYFEYKNQFTYSIIERFNHPDELQHPLVREALKCVPVDRIQIAYDADLPACSGIGSSSAFAVGLLKGLHAMNGSYPDQNALAEEAIHLERVVLKESGGVQDQYEAAWGGFNKYEFSGTGVVVQKIMISENVKHALESNLFLLFTGFTRYSGEIANEQKRNTEANVPTLLKMNELTNTAIRLLQNGELDEFGRLMDASWFLKRTLSISISNEHLDAIYDRAKRSGALGGKIIGAGGGGFMLLYVPKRNQQQFFEGMENYKCIPFQFSDHGAEIIYDDSTSN